MLTISKVIHDDLEELAELFIELTGSKTNFCNMKMNFEWMESNDDYIILGAKMNGKLVGTLMGIICKDLVGECRPFMVVENVVVKSDIRGMGIGKKLLNEIESIGREKNCYYTMFVSSINRTEAHKFYESVGYSCDSVQGFKKYL